MKRILSLNRWISLALLLALTASLLPAAAFADTQYGYVTVRKDLKDRVVNFRQEPNTNDDTNYPIARLPEFWVVELVENKTLTRNGAAWYHIRANVNVDGGPVQMEEGYVMASFLTVMTEAQRVAWQQAGGNTYNPDAAPAAPAQTAAPTAVPAGAALGFIRTLVSDVNLRQTPAGKVINEGNKIPAGAVLAYYSLVTNVDQYAWAEVRYDGKTGFVRSDCYAFSDASGNLITHVTTPAPTAVPVPTAIPGTQPSTGVYGQVTGNDVLFRRSPTSTDYWDRLAFGWRMEVLGQEMANGVLWYKVQGGIPSNPSHVYVGYIHSGYFRVIPSTAAPDSGTESDYALITLGGINLRATPAGATIVALPAGKVVSVITKPAGNSASDWYYVDADGQAGYLPATALRVLLTGELAEYGITGGGSVIIVPTAQPTPGKTGSGYIRLILDKVNLRRTPGGTVVTATEESKLKAGTVLAYSEGPVSAAMSGRNYEWVLVQSGENTGYVRSDCYIYCDAAGNPVNSPSTPIPTAFVPTATPANSSSTTQGYIKLIRGDVNVRLSPWGSSLGRLLRNTVLPYFSIKPYNNGNEMWYEVYSTQLGTFGFVLSTMAELCDAAGNPLNGNPGSDVPTNPETIIGYVATSASLVWVRRTPGGSTADQIKDKGTVLPLIGAPAAYGTNYIWYPVKTASSIRGYIRGDYVYQLADWQVEAYNKTGRVPTPTPAPATPRPGTSDYIQITADKVWVREMPSKQSGTLGQVSTGFTAMYYQKQVVGNGANAVTWYQIAYSGRYGWVHGGYAKVLSNGEADVIVGTASPAPTPVISGDTTLSDLALTTAGQVNIRATASMTAKALTQVPKAKTAITYLGQYVAPTAQNPYTWYYVRYSGTTGWIRGDFVRVLTNTEKAQYQATGTVDDQQSATYRTLSKGSTGADVTALQKKLSELGYLAASQISGTYLSSTETAVIAFQKAKGLTVDGIAGSKTQHALFGTAEPTDGSSVTVTLYPVEKIDWFTGGIQSIWKVNTVAIITDVYTGISFKAQRLYGDNHADCEPLTTADTAAICKIYGVSDPQEISDREQALRSYRRRPLWVTIGGRTFCASMYGIPHNYEGDRIANNGYNGQFCVHFTNSRTHTTNVVDPDADYNDYFGHQSAIQYAYTHSKSGTK